MRTARSRDEIQRRHRQAKRAFLAILKDADAPLSTREVIARHRERCRAEVLTAGELRYAMWTLVDEGRITRTRDERLELSTEEIP